MRVGVITFPGSLDERDAQRAVRLAGGTPVALWHGAHDLEGFADYCLSRYNNTDCPFADIVSIP